MENKILFVIAVLIGNVFVTTAYNYIKNKNKKEVTYRIEISEEDMQKLCRLRKIK